MSGRAGEERTVLSLFPQGEDRTEIEAWAKETASNLVREEFSSFEKETFFPLSFDVGLPDDRLLFQRFVNALLLADWACYPMAQDKVDYARLCKALSAFPQGFRLWFCRKGDRFYPVGYTGWYPLSVDLFVQLITKADTIVSREHLLPCLERRPVEGGFFWLFNYSLLPCLRKSPQSRLMMQTYAQDIRQHCPSGLAAAIVSKEGEGVAKRFGLSFCGVMGDGDDAIWGKRMPFPNT